MTDALLETGVQTVALAHNSIVRSSINDERKGGVIPQKIKTIKSRLFREQYSEAFANSDTGRWQFKSAIQCETSDFEWEALRSFDNTYREDLKAEADKLVALRLGPTKVKGLLRKWADFFESKTWIFDHPWIPDPGGWDQFQFEKYIYIGDNPDLNIEQEVIASLQLEGRPVWDYIDALRDLLRETQDGTSVGINAAGFVAPVGDDISFPEFRKFWVLRPPNVFQRITRSIFGFSEPKIKAKAQWAKRDGYDLACELRRICSGKLEVFDTPEKYGEYLRKDMFDNPRLLIFPTREHPIEAYLQRVPCRSSCRIPVRNERPDEETKIVCHDGCVMAFVETDICWLALEFTALGNFPTKFAQLEDIAIAEWATGGELDLIRNILRWTRVGRRETTRVIGARAAVTTMTRSMLSKFSIYQTMKRQIEKESAHSGSDTDLSNVTDKELITEFLSGDYLGLGSACDAFEESRPRLQKDLDQEIEARIHRRLSKGKRSHLEREIGSWEYGGEELWVCELARSLGMREKALPKLLVNALQRSFSRVSYGRDSVAFLNAQSGLAKVWYSDSTATSTYEVASLVSDTTAEALIAAIYIGSTLRPQLRLSGGLELVMDEAATLKMIGAASDGLPKFAELARETIRNNIRSKRNLWNKFEIRFTDVLKFIEDVSHNIASSRDAAFVKREILILLGNEGVRLPTGSQTCLFDACCENRFTPTAIVGETRVSGEGVSVFKHEEKEYVKTGRGGQFARVTRTEHGTIHLSSSSQGESLPEAPVPEGLIRFDRYLEAGSQIGEHP